MEPFTILAAEALRGGAFEAHSALPDAPVVPHRSRRAAAPRVRSTLAHGLRRLADAVAPRPAVTLCADN